MGKHLCCRNVRDISLCDLVWYIMTPHERAEKIVTDFNGECGGLSNTEETYLQEMIEVQLDEAVREAELECQGPASPHLDKALGYEVGFASAREKAALIVAKAPFDRGESHHDYKNESYCVECGMCIDCGKREIAERIRAMEADK